MPTNQLYHTWIRQIRELQPFQRITRIRNMVFLIIGIYQSRSVTLSRIAGKIPGPAKLLSTTRRLSRFLANPAIEVRAWYQPIARVWLKQQYKSCGEVRLIVDGTKVGFGHQLLMVGLAFRRRTIPIAWSWVNHVKGHSSVDQQLALLRYVRGLFPKHWAVFIVGDCEFGAVRVLRTLGKWHWFYILRQKTNIGIFLDTQSSWQRFGDLIDMANQSIWLGPGFLTKKDPFYVNLLIHWKAGETEPWCLATNLPDKAMALRFYKRRMWIEEMFGDFKAHGFDLEHTMLIHQERLSRLTLAVCMLYVWLLSKGARVIRNGLRHLVDRNDRRDLCVFQIGLRFIERRLINDLPIQICLCIHAAPKPVR